MKQLALFGEAKKLKVKRTPKPRRTVARVLHLGAGVQSSALAEMIVEGVLQRVDFAIFADTGDEPKYVYEQVEYLGKRFAGVGIPLAVIQREGKGVAEDLLHGQGRHISMPFYVKSLTGDVAMVRRQCTDEFKVVPSDSYVMSWLIEREYGKWSKGKIPRRLINRDIRVEDVFGISLDEFYRAGDRGVQWQKAVYPLIDQRMTRADCEQWLRDHSLPVPRKSSCRKCPYHQDAYWLDQKINHPADFEESCQFDEWLRTPEAKQRMGNTLRGELYLHESCIPLREVDFVARIAAKQASPLLDFTDPLCGNHCRI